MFLYLIDRYGIIWALLYSDIVKTVALNTNTKQVKMLKLSIQRQISMPYYFLHIQLSKTKIIKNSLLVRMCGNRLSYFFCWISPWHMIINILQLLSPLHYFLIIQSPRQKNLIGSIWIICFLPAWKQENITFCPPLLWGWKTEYCHPPRLHNRDFLRINSEFG